MERYRAVMLTRRGGPEVLETVELPVREPGPGEARLRVRATGAGGTDLTMRRGRYPFAPPIPFVPGYEVIGDVEALGPGVTNVRAGDKVAALVVHGGYAERIVRPARDLVSVPSGLDDGDAVALILNYVTAYQAIHRVAHVQPGQTALVTGANGGVGTALVDLLRLAGASVYAAAARPHHEGLRDAGAIPIDGRAQPIDRALREVLPSGVDVAFDGLGGRFVLPTLRATRLGGRVVGYGFSGAGPSQLASIGGMAALFALAPLLGRRGSFYGITLRYRRDPRPFREDLATLFALLAAGRIRPRIAARLPLLAAREASEWLERGGVQGKIVHLASA